MIYFFKEFFKKMRVEIKWTVNDNIKKISENFIIIDNQSLSIYWKKSNKIILKFFGFKKTNYIKHLENLYNQINPDIVFIPNKDDFNMDHKTVHEVCEILVRRYQDNPPEQILMYEIPSSTTQSFENNFKCNYYVSLSEENLNNKVQTFLVYDNEVRDFPNPRSKDGIVTYALFRGMECNSWYAEGFYLIYQKS